MLERRRPCRVDGQLVDRARGPKCRERDPREDRRPQAGAHVPCRVNLRDGTSWACCSKAVLTFDQPSADCLQLGSPFEAPLIALTARASEAPLLFSWQSALPTPAQLRPPTEAPDTLRLEDGTCPALPIIGLVPSSRFLGKGVPAACSVVCMQRPWRTSFEVFFLSWDVSCGYALVGTGASWVRVPSTGKLEEAGPSEVRLRLLSCRELPDAEARLFGTRWVASFEAAPMPSPPRQGCDAAKASEEGALQSWLKA